ncbi:DUF5698 domain-containing protein [Helicovermis profundi]|uniref:DUF5698 domain-containing protein n=1 Tax=Helicovermis profundi TaxID=3065157 RepID=A0AAU9E5Q6_9FIRM|nr:DUF5698 domain-containing protein [Clostridia bacterium S502]
MTNEVIIAVIGLFLITSFTNILATLKTILISKKIMNPVYIVVFIDATIFASILTKVVSSGGIYFTLAYALGKTFGVFIGGKVEERLALGIIEVDLFLNDQQKMVEIAERLRKEGYTVNNFLARGINGERRHKVEIVMERKEFKNFEVILKNNGILEPELKIKNISKTSGSNNKTNLARA